MIEGLGLIENSVRNISYLSQFSIRKVVSIAFVFCWMIISLPVSHAADTPTIKKLLEDSVSLLINKSPKQALEKLDQVLLLSPGHPEAHFRKGQALIQDRKAVEGLSLIVKSTQLDPTNVRYSLYLGRIYSKQGKTDKAMEEYQRVIDTGTRDLRVKEAEKLLSLATGRSLILRKESNAALLIFNGLLLEYPEDPQVLFSIANTYMELGRIEEAERSFVKLHSLGPQNPSVNFSLAKIYELTKQPQLAMKHLKMIMDLNLNNPMARNAAAQYYIIEGRVALANKQWEVALKSLQKVVNIDPNRTEAFFNISMANLQLGNTLMAERGFLSVLKVTPTHFLARLNLGQMYFDIGKIDEAKEQFQFIIDNDKTKRYGDQAKKRMNFLHSHLADKALKAGNIESGMLEYEKALSFSNANTKASFTRGMIFIKQQKFPEARKEFESVIKFSPKNVQARVNLGNVYERLSLFTKAAEQYEMVMDLDKNGKAGRFAASKWKITKGRGLWSEKRLTEAEKLFEELTLEQPNNFQAFAFLGILQSSKGKLREAAQSYQRVLDLQPTNYAIKILLGKVFEQLGLDSLAANEYRSIIFAGGKIRQVPEAESRLAAVEARLSGFSNTLNYRFSYNNNTNYDDVNPIEEVRSDLALSFNYALKTRDDLSFSLSWSPTYSSLHFAQTDYLVSVLQSYTRLGTPGDNWNIAFLRQDQESLVNDLPLNKATSFNLGRTRKVFATPIFNLAPVEFEGEDIATNVSLTGGLRHVSTFNGVGLQSVMGTFTAALSQQLKWGIAASAGYTLGIYRNLAFEERFAGTSFVEIDGVSGREIVRANRTLSYNSDDYEYNSHRGQLSLRKTIAPGLIGILNLSGTFTGYTNPDSAAEIRGKLEKRLNFGMVLAPSLTYVFYKDIRFVVSGSFQKSISNLPVGLSGGFVDTGNGDNPEAQASFQSRSLGEFSRFSVDTSFIMNF